MFFSVSIFLRSSQPVGDEVLLEETIRLVEAQSYEDAISAAELLAKSLEISYRNALGSSTAWTVEEIEEPQEIVDSLSHGAELCSRTLTLSEREALKRKHPNT